MVEPGAKTDAYCNTLNALGDLWKKRYVKHVFT